MGLNRTDAAHIETDGALELELQTPQDSESIAPETITKPPERWMNSRRSSLKKQLERSQSRNLPTYASSRKQSNKTHQSADVAPCKQQRS
jgi:hypothetical protein